jgi:hypothetical protein
MKEPINTETHKTPDVSGVQNPEVAHEYSDVSVSGITWFGAGLFVLIALICVLMWFMSKLFEGREVAAEPPPASRVTAGEPRLPPEPRLQGVPGHETLPQEDMKQLRESQEAVLKSYGWIDQQSGRVRIPIETAKRLIVERGLPPQSSQPAPREKR